MVADWSGMRVVSGADPRCGGIGGGAGGGRGRGLPSQNKAVPRADAAPESVTTLDSATNGRPDRFSTINTSWRECAGCGAQSARVSGIDGATRRATSVPWVSGHTRCLHACWRAKLITPIFGCRETMMGPCPRRRTVCESVGERRRMLFAYLGYPVTPMHVCGGERDPIFGCRETVMGRRNSHLKTLRRTQEVGKCPQNTVLEA